MELATDSKQITILYVGNSPRAKQTMAYCTTAGIPIREIDIIKTKLTGTMISEIATALDLPMEGLINSNHPIFHKYYQDAQFNDNDVIKIIQKHPDIMKQPIVMRGDKVVLIETPTDVLKLTV